MSTDSSITIVTDAGLHKLSVRITGHRALSMPRPCAIVSRENHQERKDSRTAHGSCSQNVAKTKSSHV